MRWTTKIFFIFLATVFAGCAFKGGKKTSVDFKYWTVDHTVEFNSILQKVPFGSAQITSFQATERRSILGRESWNVNLEMALTNNTDVPLNLDELKSMMLVNNAAVGSETTPSPTEAGAQFIIDKTKKPRLLILKPKSSGKVRLGFSLGGSDLVNQPISLKLGPSSIVVK